jgi:predicted RNA methylase
MAKLTKKQAQAHEEACQLLSQDVLTFEDKIFVLENWQESAKHINSIAGAFFTPSDLARDFSIEVGHGRVIDLCAGIGSLAFWAMEQNIRSGIEIVCVELNPDYVEVGKKIVPEATWINGSVFELPNNIGHFDFAIGNPPFGATPRDNASPRYSGREFELHVIDIASDIADYGAFIIPQNTAPFRFSGCPNGGWPQTIKNGVGNGYYDCPTKMHENLLKQTGIQLDPSCGLDTDQYRDQWHGVSVKTEIVTVDFVQARERRQSKQPDMFEAA